MSEPSEPAQVPDLITTPDALDELIGHLRDARRFAFDTEFVSEETFEPVLCLVQVATTERMALIDPLAFKNVQPFWDAVNDPNIEVVMHASGEDMRICQIQSGRLPSRIVDVQIASGLVGYGYPISLGNLVRQELGISLPGGETRTDWRRRPLSPAQLRYALDDVAHLLTLADKLGNRLKQWGRLEWGEGEYRERLRDIMALDDGERWRKLPGLHHLSRRGLEVARRLAEWRKADAQKTNQPLRRLMRDDLLVAIAKRQPSSRRDLEALREFNRPHLLAKAHEILNVVATAAAVPADQLPEHRERGEEGPGLSMVVSLLAATLNQSCAQAKIATSLVGTNADLKQLVSWYADGCPEQQRPELVRGWREELCGKTLLDVLSGRRALRVVDPKADVPVALDPI
jgi:ribonuclease D